MILSSYSHMLVPSVRSRSIFCCGVKQRGREEVLSSFRPAFSWQKPSWMSARLACHALRKSVRVHCRGGVAFNTLVTQFSHVTSSYILIFYLKFLTNANRSNHYFLPKRKKYETTTMRMNQLKIKESWCDA